MRDAIIGLTFTMAPHDDPTQVHYENLLNSDYPGAYYNKCLKRKYLKELP